MHVRGKRNAAPPGFFWNAAPPGRPGKPAETRKTKEINRKSKKNKGNQYNLKGKERGERGLGPPRARSARGPQGPPLAPLSFPSLFPLAPLFSLQIVLTYQVFLRSSFISVTFDFQKPLAPVSSNRRRFGCISHQFRFGFDLNRFGF